MTNYRSAAVAGSFYPAHQDELLQNLDHYYDEVSAISLNDEKSKKPLAIIVPHAGYIYSGQTAAFAYENIKPFKSEIRRVLLLGPSHYHSFYGLAIPSVDAFLTPLGMIPLDQAAREQLLKLNTVILSDEAHEKEHSLEVQLPFLQTALDDFNLIPLAVGQIEADKLAGIIESLLTPDTLIVISTDLSHFEDYDSAVQHDNNTNDLIMKLDYQHLDYHDACGRIPLSGLLHLARQQHFHIENLHLCNSGDTAGSKDRVVGYGAWSLFHA